MSVIRKVPFIKYLIDDLTAQQKTTLLDVINGEKSLVNASFDNMPNDAITPVLFKLNERDSKTGILILSSNYRVLIAYHRFQDLLMIKLNSDNTYEKINEYLDINELRRLVEEADDHIVATEIDSGEAQEGLVLTADGEGGASWENMSEVFNEGNVDEGDAVKLFGFDANGKLVQDDIPEGITVDQSVIEDSTNAVAGGAVYDALQDVDEELETKANVDGNYPTMTVGNSDQLNSTVFVVDKVPYLYRTSGGDADIGNREYDKIIGGSLVVNQLINPADIIESGSGSGYSWVKNQNGSITITVTETLQEDKTFGLTANTSSKYLKIATGAKFYYNLNNSNTNIWLNNGYNGSNYRSIGIGEQPASAYGNVYLNLTLKSGLTAGTYNVNLNFINLTQMFGSTIADYIYSLEQANAGAGVAWFKNYFKEEYYPFNSGAIKNVKLVSHNMVGFNQWDGENDIKAFANTTYYIYGSATLTYKDHEGNTISSESKSNETFTTPANCEFVEVNGTDDICINLSWSGWRNGQCEKYQKNSYPLDTTIELRGIPKLDSNNHLYFDGDEYSSDGKVVRKYGSYTFTGNETWVLNDTQGFWWVNNLLPADKKGISGNQNNYRLSNGMIISIIGDNRTIRVYFSDNPQITSSTNMNQIFVSGTKLDYTLVDSYEETAAPFQEPQIVDDFGTEEYVVPTQDGWQVPVGHDTKYPANLRDKLQRLPDMPSVSQNVTETYVVNYNGTTKKCTFVDIAGWLGANGWIKLTDITGYDAEKTQSLKNVNGTLTWVTEGE